MAEIIPAIIAPEFNEIKKKVGQVEGLVNWVQIDVVDGLFAENYTWEHFQDLADLPGKVKVEIHLMVEQPEHYVSDWMQVADRIIVHVEATEKMSFIIDQFANVPVRLGLAALWETPVKKLAEYGHRVDLIQLMGIKNVGVQGEKFEAMTFDRVQELRKEFPKTTIAVDGGIDLANGKELIAAGANNLVIGSEIWHSKDIAATIKEFQKL